MNKVSIRARANALIQVKIVSRKTRKALCAQYTYASFAIGRACSTNLVRVIGRKTLVTINLACLVLKIIPSSTAQAVGQSRGSVTRITVNWTLLTNVWV